LPPFDLIGFVRPQRADDHVNDAKAVSFSLLALSAKSLKPLLCQLARLPAVAAVIALALQVHGVDIIKSAASAPPSRLSKKEPYALFSGSGISHWQQHGLSYHTLMGPLDQFDSRLIPAAFIGKAAM
jgi:hypothetical protein